MAGQGNPQLILASASQRRLDLLRQAGLEPDAVVPAEIDETPLKDELPRAYARRMADRKAAAVASAHPGAYLAAKCLSQLSGKRHKVLGGLTVLGPGGQTSQKLVTTQVTFKRLTPQEIESYLESGEWQGKAGGYAIQGRAAAFIPYINGSYPNVVGLPLFETLQALKGLGYPA